MGAPAPFRCNVARERRKRCYPIINEYFIVPKTGKNMPHDKIVHCIREYVPDVIIVIRIGARLRIIIYVRRGVLFNAIGGCMNKQYINAQNSK